MRHRKKAFGSLLSLFLLVLLHWGLNYFPESKQYIRNTKIAAAEVAGEKIVTSTWAMVSKVVDGDTIELDSGQKVRYIGVDTPETVHPSKPVQCFGKEASIFNKQLVTGKKVRLVKDVSETDRYGRLLRYVYLEDGTFVNEVLIKKGYAHAATFPPDVLFNKLFLADMQSARAAELGLWSACK